jgi:GT2 family glycosyltransferase
MNVSVVVISKDEPSLNETLESLAVHARDQVTDVVVVDASSGRMDSIREAHPWVRWIDFEQPWGVRVSIPHQRNTGVGGASGDVIVFLDCGCIAGDAWLNRLLAPIRDGDEAISCGVATKPSDLHSVASRTHGGYMREAPTINLAFRREAFDRVGGFDESFEYGSDVDFTWRLVDAGFRIRFVEDAVVEADWGDSRRQVKRGMIYGRARVRLYAKHRMRIPRVLAHDPVPFVYAAFLLGLPLTLKFRPYPLLLAVPLWRARKHPRPFQVVAEHLGQGAGAIRELAHLSMRVLR